MVGPKEVTSGGQELECPGKEVKKGVLRGLELSRRTFPMASCVVERGVSAWVQAELAAGWQPVVAAHFHQPRPAGRGRGAEAQETQRADSSRGGTGLGRCTACSPKPLAAHTRRLNLC